MEKISSFAKDNRIKTLEELVLNIGYDPSNVKAAEEMIKKKNVDIASVITPRNPLWLQTKGAW